MPGTFLSPAELRCTTPPAAAAAYSSEQVLDFTEETLLEPHAAQAATEEGYVRAEGFADAEGRSLALTLTSTLTLALTPSLA